MSLSPPSLSLSLQLHEHRLKTSKKEKQDDRASGMETAIKREELKPLVILLIWSPSSA